MKTFWNMLSFLAVVNLLALAMLGGWLWKTDRLDRDRLQKVRELFAVTLGEEQAAMKAADEAARIAREGADPADPLVPAVARLEQMSLVREQEVLGRRRMAEEQRMLLTQLDERSRLAEEQAATLDADRDRGAMLDDPARKQLAETQFAKAVKQLESLPPKQGKKILADLIGSGDWNQAVAYLDAMTTRAAAKVLREFKTDAETALATELLERLRSYGLAGSTEDESANAQPADSIASPPPGAGLSGAGAAGS